MDTIEQAMYGHRVLEIECEACGNARHMWAYRVYHMNQKLGPLPLRKPIRGFRCKQCGNGSAILRPDGPHD